DRDLGICDEVMERESKLTCNEMAPRSKPVPRIARAQPWRSEASDARQGQHIKSLKSNATRRCIHQRQTPITCFHDARGHRYPCAAEAGGCVRRLFSRRTLS